MKTIMTLFGLLFLGGGGSLLYYSVKRKFIKTKEGETFRDVINQSLDGDINEGMKRGFGMGFSAYTKVMGTVGGFFMMLIGVLFLLFSSLFR